MVTARRNIPLPTGASAGASSRSPSLYPLVLGSDLPPRDLATRTPTVTQPRSNMPRDRAGGPARERMVGKNRGNSYIDSGSDAARRTKVGEQTASATADGRLTSVSGPARKTGGLFYHCTRRQKSCRKTEQPSSEATIANNESVSLSTRKHHDALLYSADAPMGVRFLHRAIKEDPQTQLVGLSASPTRTKIPVPRRAAIE